MVILEPPSETLALLRSALPESHPGSCNGNFKAKIGAGEDGDCEEILAYVATLAATLAEAQDFDSSKWIEGLAPYMSSVPSFTSDVDSESAIEKFRSLAEAAALNADSDDEDDEDIGEQICNIKFR